MLSSADESQINDKEQRKDSLKPPNTLLSKKQKKKAKKTIASKAAISSETESGHEGSTPPIDFLVPPSSEDHLLLSSSPEGTLSEPEAPTPDTPLFAQDLSEDEGVPAPLLSSQKTVTQTSNHVVKETETIKDDFGDDDSGHARHASQHGAFKPAFRLTTASEVIEVTEPQMQAPIVAPQTDIATRTNALERTAPMASTPGSLNTSNGRVAPPPHLPQSHFNRLPDQIFGLDSTESEVRPGTSEYFCGFDTLDGAANDLIDTASNVLLVGSEGTLDVSRYTRHRREIIARIESLHGSVIDARILPAPVGADHLAALRPLLLCTVHGPRSSELPATAIATLKEYSTRVEVCSLRTSKRLCTLFETAPQIANTPLAHPKLKPPTPSAALNMSACGSYITVASGISGEVYLFTTLKSLLDRDYGFTCVGKFWARLRPEITPAPTDPETADHKNWQHTIRAAPILDLSKRWLAVSVPHLSSAQKSIEGQVKVRVAADSASSIGAYVSPPASPPTCEVDAPIGPGFINRVTKQATKEIRKHAQWVGEQGMSAIKSYWNKSTDMGEAPAPNRPDAETRSAAFPPTHAYHKETSTVKIEPALVSIYDLGAPLEDSHTKLNHLAAFQLVDGCSFLSFSPNGLSLLATNQVGDASVIWDIMSINDASAAMALKYCQPQIPRAAGVIRKITTFSRLSPSVVVDVQWTFAGNRLGILTSKGTIHLHELPHHDPMAASSLRSPISPVHVVRSDLPSPSTSPQDLSSGWINNVRSGWENVSGRLSAIRSTSEPGGGLVSTTRQSLGQASVAARRVSGRAVRTSYNTAVEGAYTLRHSQDNKIRMKLGQQDLRPGCLRWSSGRDEGLIATVSDGTLCTYAVKSHYHVQGRRTVVVLDASRKAGPSQTLPPIATYKLPPAISGLLDPTSPHASCARAGIHGFWTLNGQGLRQPLSQTPSLDASGVQQDKETCPQLLPFHRLRQVTFFTYNDRSPREVERSLGMNMGQQRWCFGGDLDAVPRSIVAPQKSLDGHGPDQDAFEGVVGHMEDDYHLDHAATGQAAGQGPTIGFGARDSDLL